MRIWQIWWRNLVFSVQYNPPVLVELVMALLAMVLLLFWGITGKWHCIVLSASYAIGASLSMWVREVIAPSPHHRLTLLLAFTLFLYSFSSLAELAPYFIKTVK